jgi:hypothetical protein
VPLNLQPGQKVDLKLGQPEATVNGKVKLTGKVPSDLDCTYSLNYLVSRTPGIEPPPSIVNMGFDIRKGWQSTWLKTKEGQTYLSTLQHWFVKLSPEGEFRISGVPPGEYDLAIEIYAKPSGCLVDPLARKVVRVNVTEADVTRGELTLPEIFAEVAPRPTKKQPLSTSTESGAKTMPALHLEPPRSGPAPAGEDDIVATGICGLKLLMQPRVVRQLALTSQQKEGLRAIGAQFDSAEKIFFSEAKKEGKLSGDKLTAAFLAWKREADKKYLKEAEALLTPAQTAALRAATLAEDACFRLYPESLPGLTKAQNDQLRRLFEEDRQQMVRRLPEESDKKLAVLTPHQRVKLRTEILETGLTQCSGQRGIKIKGEHAPLWIYTSTGEE